MKKAAIGTAVVIAGASAAALLVLEPVPRIAAPAVSVSSPAETNASRLPSGLPERQSFSGGRTDVFAAAPWAQPPAAPKPSKPAVQESASAGVSAPPVPYRFVGTVKHGGEVVYALAKGDSVLPINEGDTLEGIYYVEAIKPQMVTLVYIPLEERTMLVLATPPRDAASAPRPGMPGQSFPVIAPPASQTQAGAPTEDARPPAMRAAQMRGQRNPH